MVYGKLTIKLLSVKSYTDIIVRKLELIEGADWPKRPCEVTVLQLTSWPMRGLPHSTAILSLINQLTSAQRRSSAKRTIVMCRSDVYSSSMCGA